MEQLPPAFEHFRKELKEKIRSTSEILDISKGTEIVRTGQYPKVIPIVIEGAIKVFSQHNDKELLLYYIRPNESCVMSFAASLHNTPSRIAAVAEEDSKVVAIPSREIFKWTVEFPEINTLFYQQYHLRYGDLIDTIDQVLFHRLDERLHDYLVDKVTIAKSDTLKISHKEVARELGTAREVISRVMKKLENEGKVKQLPNAIKVLAR